MQLGAPEPSPRTPTHKGEAVQAQMGLERRAQGPQTRGPKARETQGPKCSGEKTYKSLNH